MKSYKTISEANAALDKFLCREGYNMRGGKYCRPNGTKGAVVRYDNNGLALWFAVDRVPTGGWTVSAAWFQNDKHIMPPDLLFGFWMWQEAVDNKGSNNE